MQLLQTHGTTISIKDHILELRGVIIDMMRTQALGAITDYKNRTATESEIRAKYIEKINNVWYDAFMNECAVPVMERVLDIITNPIYYSDGIPVVQSNIDDKSDISKIKWNTPLDSTEKQMKFQQTIQVLAEVFSFVGQSGLGVNALNVKEIIGEGMEAYSINKNIINTSVFTQTIKEATEKAELQQAMALNTAQGVAQ